jgi:hypothetical protein
MVEGDLIPALNSINRSLALIRRPRALRSAYLNPEFRGTIAELTDAVRHALHGIDGTFRVISYFTLF